MAFAERRDSDIPDAPRTLEPAVAGTGGIQMNSFGFWQQGLAPGSWSQQVLARNLDGEDFAGYRRASDPPHPRASGGHLPEAEEVRPEDIVVENGSLVGGPGDDGAIAAIGRLVAAFGDESSHDEIDAAALVQPPPADVYEIDLVGTVAESAGISGTGGSPLLSPMRGAGASAAAPADAAGLDGIGPDHPFRRTTDPDVPAAETTGPAAGFFPMDEVSRPVIQSAEDFLLL
ncbi:hypothetical protein [Nisaea sp.]|uniref:hypothetical protein n=1 Tax=Nisaea sp. TaxID=2024842 RepID=UPI0032EDAA7F